MNLPRLKLSKRQRIWLWIAIFIVVAIPTAYLLNFSNRPISNDTIVWGTFGDFIGGLLGPVVSILTLVVTVIIALFLAKNEEEKTNASTSASYQPHIVAEQSLFYTYLSTKFAGRKTVGFSKEPNPGLVGLQSPNLFGI